MMAKLWAALTQEGHNGPRRTLFPGTTSSLVPFPITEQLPSLSSLWLLSSLEISLRGIHSSVLILRVSVKSKPVYPMYFPGVMLLKV